MRKGGVFVFHSHEYKHFSVVALRIVCVAFCSKLQSDTAQTPGPLILRMEGDPRFSVSISPRREKLKAS